MTADKKNYDAYDAPAGNGEVVSPSDTVDTSTPFRAIYVGAAGNVAVITLGGATLTFIGVQSGSILPVRGTRVKLTNTTAGSMIALW